MNNPLAICNCELKLRVLLLYILYVALSYHVHQVGFGLYPVIVKQFAAKNNANPLIFSFYRYQYLHH